MRNLSKLIVLLLSLLALSGCQLLKPKVVKNTVYVVPSIPSKLLEPCPPPAPPEQSTYTERDPLVRERMLTEYSISLLTTVSTCNVKINKIKQFMEDTKKAVAEKKDKKE